MHKEKYGILNILEIVHTMSANAISADIVLPSTTGLLTSKHILKQIRKTVRHIIRI